ncbi:acetyl-CoA carboxylase biotin carboxyl carrier protein [Treponema lecithinolyticum]
MKDIFVLKLMQHFEKSNSVFLHIKDGENELTLKKEGAFHSVSPIPVGFPANPAQNAAQNVFTASMGEAALQTAGQSVESAVAASATTALPNNIQQNTAADANTVTVKSPIVGTFYRSPSPDAPAYVEKGSTVHKGQPLCVLEAMKMMNTLECEYDGVVEDVLAANGDLVEFDQPLFVIRKK